MKPNRAIQIEPLSKAAFSPYGQVLGTPFPLQPGEADFTHPGSDFWHMHDFNPGAHGTSEVLWVNYRNDSMLLRTLEVHWLTQQAIVPLGNGTLVHVVCPTRDDGSQLPDIDRLRAFLVTGGQGVCMNPGCWHNSFVFDGQTTCLMLTRSSSTRDLVSYLNGKSVAVESAFFDLAASEEGEIKLKA